MSGNQDLDHYDQANRLFIENRPVEAMSYVLEGLQANPEHLELLTLAGDIYITSHEDLGMSEEEACELALDAFLRAIKLEPGLVEAWEGKSRALVHLGRYQEALCAAEEGFKVLPMRIGIPNDEIYTNVAESLFDHKVRALLSLGRNEEAREALSEGFRHCPGSSYLSELIDELVPGLGGLEQD